MIELVLNDRLGKKIRVKCKYVIMMMRTTEDEGWESDE